MELGHFKGSGVLPLGVPIAFIKLNSMVIVPRDFVTILVSWGRAIGPELGLVNHAEELLISLGYALKPFPTVKI